MSGARSGDGPVCPHEASGDHVAACLHCRACRAEREALRVEREAETEHFTRQVTLLLGDRTREETKRQTAERERDQARGELKRLNDEAVTFFAGTYPEMVTAEREQRHRAESAEAALAGLRGAVLAWWAQWAVSYDASRYLSGSAWPVGCCASARDPDGMARRRWIVNGQGDDEPEMVALARAGTPGGVADGEPSR
jgi:hypothetical protein